MDRLYITVEDDDAVAFGLHRQAVRRAGGAADQQQGGQTLIESPHGIDSFFGGLALVQRCEEGQQMSCRVLKSLLIQWVDRRGQTTETGPVS
jgi:hypothetical protein